MKRIFLALVMVFVPSLVSAQAITSYTLTISTVTPPAVVSTTVIPAASFVCNQTPLAGANTINPQHVEVDDPANTLPPVTIVSNSATNPTVVTTAAAHGLIQGQSVAISAIASGSIPDISGIWTATVIDATHFSIPVAVTQVGVSGTSSAVQVCIYGPDPPTGPLNSLPFGAAQYTGTILATNSSGNSDPSVSSLPFTHPGSRPPARTGVKVVR